MDLPMFHHPKHALLVKLQFVVDVQKQGNVCPGNVQEIPTMIALLNYAKVKTILASRYLLNSACCFRLRYQLSNRTMYSGKQM